MVPLRSTHTDEQSPAHAGLETSTPTDQRSESDFAHEVIAGIDVDASALTVADTAARGPVRRPSERRGNTSQPAPHRAGLSPHLQEGSAATVLSEATRTAAPIILGNRGRSGLTSLLLGSVRRGWLNQMTAPALIVPRMTAQSALCAPVAIRRVRHLSGVLHSPELYIM